jgi:hypothetical protein
VSSRNHIVTRTGEGGHVGALLATILGIAAAMAIVVAFAADSDIAGIIGGVLTGLGIFAAVNAPHEWFKRTYPRLDKLDPEEQRTGFRIEY